MKRKQKEIVLILIILLAGMLIFSKYLYSQIQKNKDFEDVKTEIYEEMKNEMVMPNGVFQLKKNYSGDNDVKDFYRSVYTLSRGLINLSKENIKDVDKYFEKNKTEIRNTFGITTLEDFQKLHEYVKSFDKLKGFNSASIDTDSIENKKKYMEFDMTIVYDGDKNLKFNVRFMNNNSERVLVKYTVAE